MALCRKETDHVDHGEVQESSRHTQINPKAKSDIKKQRLKSWQRQKIDYTIYPPEN